MSRLSLMLLGVAGLLSAVSPPSAFGQCAEHNYYWATATGDWSVPENWQHEEWDPDLEECVWVPGVPSSADWTYVQTGQASITAAGAICDWLHLDSGLNVLSGGDLLAHAEVIGDGAFGALIQTGGANTVSGADFGIILGNHPGAEGRYELHGGTLSVDSWIVVGGWDGTGTFVHTGGTNNISLELAIANTQPSTNGTYLLSGTGELYASYEVVGWVGTGTFVQTGGTNTITGDHGIGLLLGNEPGAEGHYDLSGSSVLSAYWEVVGWAGTGTFIQTGGINTVTEDVSLGKVVGSHGTYELGGDAELSARWGAVGEAGTGVFIQTGGTYTVTGEGGGGAAFHIGAQPGSDGRYEMSGGTLSAPWVVVGWAGTGTFIQTGGTNTVTEDVSLGKLAGSHGTYELSGDGDLHIGAQPGSDGRYELNGGTLAAGGPVWVGLAGTGAFVMDGGTIIGTTPEARAIVNGSTGTLTGAGTFNIAVTYESPKLYGANGDQSVDSTFPPNGLTAGGAYGVAQLTPGDFAGGTLPNLLPSSVFDVSFSGSYAGEFEIAIPYDESEVFQLGGTEMALWAFRQTGPETYEFLNLAAIDPENNTVFARSSEFGRFALGVIWTPEDWDFDGDVDLDDFAIFVPHITGPAVPTMRSSAFDLNDDGHVDLADFAVFQVAFTGPLP